MPSIRESQNIDRGRLHDHHIMRGEQPSPAPMLPVGVSPFMGSSLPVIASGNDLYTRQFYGTSRLPQRRFLPVGGL